MDLQKLLRCLSPGLVFVGVVIGGGYATGRELVTFFLSHGIGGALLGMAATMILWGFFLSIAFNYAVLTRNYNYDGLMRDLIGPLRFALEAVFLTFLILVIAVISDAAGIIVANRLGASPIWGVIALAIMLCLGLLPPEKTLRNLMVYWSILLYFTYIILFIIIFTLYADKINSSILHAQTHSSWLLGAVQYAGYNLAAFPAILFALKPLQSKKEARLAGIFAGILGMLPAFIFAIALFAFMPEILNEPVPLTVVLNAADIGGLTILFDIVIFGTLAQTGIGSLNALNARLAAGATSRFNWQLPPWARASVGMFVIFLSLVIGVQFGVIEIVAKGYGYLTYAFLILLVGPILTIGFWRCLRPAKQTAP